MKKDFAKWHKEKQRVQSGDERVFYHEREVRWCSLGLNVGFESDGKGDKYLRPVLIVRGFSREVCFCVPVTTKVKKGIFYHPVDLEDGIKRTAMLSQLRLLDTKRLHEMIGTAGGKQFKEIKQAITRLFE